MLPFFSYGLPITDDCWFLQFNRRLITGRPLGFEILCSYFFVDILLNRTMGWLIGGLIFLPSIIFFSVPAPPADETFGGSNDPFLPVAKTFGGIGSNDPFLPVARTYGGGNDPATVRSQIREGRICIVGVGGVGSHCAEAVVRSGVEKHVALIDADEVCISNLNRQVHALHSTVGKQKVAVLKSRFVDINPHCNITTVSDFLTSSNVASILENCFENKFDVVVDCTDNAKDKAAIIDYCYRHAIPCVTVGAAAGRIDPTSVRAMDLVRAKNDSLLSSVRRELRRSFNFPKGPGAGVPNTHKPKKWNIQCVSSSRQPPTPATQKINNLSPPNSLRFCDNFALGTSPVVVGIFGYISAQIAIDTLISRSDDRRKMPQMIEEIM